MKFNAAIFIALQLVHCAVVGVEGDEYALIIVDNI